MNGFKHLFMGLFLLSSLMAHAQTKARNGPPVLVIAVDIVAKDTLHIVKLDKNPSLFYFYIISGEPIPELDDKEAFKNIVDSDSNVWPVVEAGYIDTRYGVSEFAFDLHGKNFYLMATNGDEYSKVIQYDFH
jgi:hypothetical protein